MRIEFDDGTLLLHGAFGDTPHAEWNDHVDEYHAQAYRYRLLLEWADMWVGKNEQLTLQGGFDHTFEGTARAYPVLDLTPTLHTELRDYQQTALDARTNHSRRRGIVLPMGSGKAFPRLQVIAGAGAGMLVVTPTIDLVNQRHTMLTNAFSGQLPGLVGVLGGSNHDATAVAVTTYDSACRYVSEYGDQFGLSVVNEEHHLPPPTYWQILEMTIVPYRLGLTAAYERPDDKHELLEDLLGPVAYRGHVDDLAGRYLSEYETIHMSVDLTTDEREAYDEKYKLYRGYVDNHDFDPWKERGYQELLKRTSYDPQGRQALIVRQRAERLVRAATERLDTFDNLIKHYHGDRAIIFTANNGFACEVFQEFIVLCITHQTKTDERTEILERSHTGEYSMLAASQVLDEGIGVPVANIGIILPGSASERQYAQWLGRILRPTDDRQPARLYRIIAEDTMETYVSQHRREGVNTQC